MWSELPTGPIVARQFAGTRRTSPEGRVIWAQVPSRAVSVALVPAERQSLAPPPGCISMLWICMPVGIFDSGMQLPSRGSASGPLCDGHAGGQAVGGDDVALLAGVLELDQGDPRRAVRVVLDVRDLGRHAVACRCGGSR